MAAALEPPNLRPADTSTCKAAIRGGAFVLLDFWSAGCGPCRSLEPVIADLANRHPSLTVLEVDVEAEGDLADELGVQSVPSLLLFKAGDCVGRLVGKVSYVQMERLIAQHA